jgi:hypothetical protein
MTMGQRTTGPRRTGWLLEIEKLNCEPNIGFCGFGCDFNFLFSIFLICGASGAKLA